jgi:5-oxoprolinase (ATP-hydrolysing)
MASQKFQFAIDRGGTFTDCWARCPSGRTRVLKLLSEDPANYLDAPREGIRRIIEQETGHSLAADAPLDASVIDWIRMGTTVATNALLERKGMRMALVITKGFKHLLHIGNQSRPKIFDLEIVMPELLYDEVVEVEERVVLRQERCMLNRQCTVKTGITGENVEVWQDVSMDQLRADLQMVLDKGIRSLAVTLMHSYIFPDHEEQIGRLAESMGFTHVSLSSAVMPMARIVPRGYTACADAYLTPCIKKYLSSFTSGFTNLQNTRVLFMQSDGGLTPMSKFCGSRAILSGPAGGVVGYALTTFNSLTGQPVIGFDMGGTSTDVSRFAGQFEHVFETTTAGVMIQAPQLDVSTVAAGGGSRLFFRGGMFVVGPESAGAHPGPVCYKKGGPLAITDANLVLGRLIPQFFPHIFGETEDQPVDAAASKLAFEQLTREVNDFNKSQGDCYQPLTVEQVAMGFIKVANEAMCRPIRALTQARGHDTSRHVLACFGGAGGQHACAIARALGMKTVFIHKYAGILSAYGMALADVVHESQEPCALTYTPDNFKSLDETLATLTERCVQELLSQGFDRQHISTEPYLHMRYKGTDCALMCTTADFMRTSNSPSHGDFERAFLLRYRQEFGFVIPGRPILVDDVRVRGIGQTHVDLEQAIPSVQGEPPVEMTTEVFFETGYQTTNVYKLEQLGAGHCIRGPAIIIDQNSTIVVEPSCDATITQNGNISIKIGSGVVQSVGIVLDPIQLSIFSHRFMSTAEQMGRVLKRTSISTNIKERLDFSCAMFGPNGGLVANAPHIPVHLGAMQEAVQYQMRVLGDEITEGDVLLSNHPCAGGSHLPDLTVITPVFYKDQKKPVFFVASRGHHADIGGITPGSMPPHSKSIFEEGAVFKSFFLVKNGVFQETAVTEALMAPAQYPGCHGTRNLHDNLSDLRAQVAANQKGISLIQDLITEYGLNVVQAYMNHIQATSEVAVREMLREISDRVVKATGKSVLSAAEYMDDGSCIVLTISIDPVQGSAVFDFTGTTPEVYGNCNAPRAVTLSAIIYCLRCMVGHDVPLNQGCLAPVKVIIPSGCFLAPSDTAAVVGGNVLTSQRVVDVVLKAFDVCAGSQGCMNNLTFGDDEVGYYETVAGGAGAGPTWHGRSGVHTHMTNTRITDPEVLEKRYPVVLQCFGLDHSSGGKGRWHGGDGVVRELLFRKPLTLSILSERRVHRPYGLHGGSPGKCGMNLLLRADGRCINLGGKASVDVLPGDIFRLSTPGGGGYGKQE